MSSTSPNQWKLGLFVVGGLFAVFAVVTWIGAQRLQKETFIAYTFFDEPVTGLEVGSPVRFRGMTIGQITAVRAASDRRFIEVQSAIDVEKLVQIGLRDPEEVQREGPQIPPDLRAQIERSFVTGVAFVQTDFFDESVYPIAKYPFTVPDNTVHAVPSSGKSLERGIREILDRTPAMMDRLNGLLESIDTELQSMELGKISGQVSTLLERVDTAVAELDATDVATKAGETLATARDAVSELRLLLADLRQGDGSVRHLMEAGRKTLDALSEAIQSADVSATSASFRNAADDYGALGRDLQDIVPILRRTLETTGRLLEVLEREPGAMVFGREQPADPRRR